MTCLRIVGGRNLPPDFLVLKKYFLRNFKQFGWYHLLKCFYFSRIQTIYFLQFSWRTNLSTHGSITNGKTKRNSFLTTWSSVSKDRKSDWAQTIFRSFYAINKAVVLELFFVKHPLSFIFWHLPIKTLPT